MRLLFGIVVILSFFSCENKNKGQNLFLKKVFKVSIDNNTTTDLLTKSSCIYNNNVFKFGVWDKSSKNIKVLKLDSKTGIYSFDSIIISLNKAFFNNDINHNIFQWNNNGFVVYNNLLYKIFLFNKNNVFSDDYSFKNDSAVYLNFSKRPIVNNNLLLLTAYTDIWIRDRISVQNYFNRKFGLCFNLSNKTKSELNIQFPSNYKRGNYYNDPYFQITSGNDDNLYCSFSSNDSVFVYNKKGLINTFCAKSSVNHIFTPLQKEDFSKRHIRYSIEQPKYIDLIYDPYKKYYYRIFKHPYKIKKSNIKIPKIYNCQWSLIIFDSSFKKIGEQIFSPPYDISIPYHIIPSKEGILISLYNKEDIREKKEVKFGLYEIKN